LFQYQLFAATAFIDQLPTAQDSILPEHGKDFNTDNAPTIQGQIAKQIRDQYWITNGAGRH